MDNNIPNTVSENERIKTLKDAEPEILSYKNVKMCNFIAILFCLYL